MVRIIGIGDAKMDKNITDMIAYPGGQAMNIAVNAKLQGAQAGFIGCMCWVSIWPKRSTSWVWTAAAAILSTQITPPPNIR